MTLRAANFLGAPDDERRAVFDDAARRKGTNSVYIEKDFWVCRTLDLLFNSMPNGHPALFFKGGTSLSKAYGLLDRFSEDIDLVVSRESLGFSEERDPAHEGLTRKQRDRLIGELIESCNQYVGGRLVMDLREQIGGSLPGGNFELSVDPDDGSTLLFKYPTVFPPAEDYVERRIKIEAGARSAIAPSSMQSLRPYLAESLPDEYQLDATGVRTVAAERTLWDKAMILHRWCCGHRDEERLPSDQDRLSRHYYDLAILSRSAIADNALANHELRENVRQHTLVFFRRAWAKLEEAIPGSFCLVPGDAFVEALERDYKLMANMIIGDPLGFDEVIERLKDLERKINDL